MRNEIRLLTVHRVDRESGVGYCPLEHGLPVGASVICCTIEHASLSQPPFYIGLSYCWGDRDKSSKIHVNGTEVQITKNWEAALA